MILETVSVGPMQVNCYILAQNEGASAIIIDPGDNPGKINNTLDRHRLKPAFIVNTHGHYDHIGSDDDFGVPVYIHGMDLPLLKDSGLNLSGVFSRAYKVKSEIRQLEDNEIIKLDALELKVLHMPGHTPGGIALLLLKPEEKKIFTGDSLFCGGIGRTDFGGNERLLIKSIRERLLTLPEDTSIYPGHGPSSTIGEEKQNNPFLA